MKIFEIIIFLYNTEPLKIYMGIHTKIKKKNIRVQWTKASTYT